MKTREALRARPDVPNEDVDDIVALAAQLQDEANAKQEGATADEIIRVAEELDIDAQYVDAALNQWKHEKEQAAEAARREKHHAMRAQGARSRMLRMGAVAVAFGLLLLLGVGIVGSSSINSAQSHLQTTQTNLVVALDRQASLAPQWVALIGGDGVDTTIVTAETDIETRLANSQQLNQDLAAALQRAISTNGIGDQAKLNLQYDIVGTQNRITTELRRYREAEQALDDARSTFAGTIAETIGFSD